MAVQPGEETAAERPYSSLAVPKRGLQEGCRGIFTRVWSDRIRGNGFKLKEDSLDCILGRNSLL